MSLKIIGIGMPRTGTASLCEALRILGYNAIHHAPERIDLDTVNADTFAGLYDDVDAAVDMPAAFFHREIGQAYAGLGVKFILTTRDTDEWWESIKFHANKIRVSADVSHIRYTDRLHQLLFGCAEPHEFLWKRRFVDWATEGIPYFSWDLARVLCIDISAGDKWEPLCRFLGKPIPDVEFPWRNKKELPE
ncbi:hypothetical protein LCGC14_0336180 [marine sediment metagenome]|uniref:Sulfotransferase domain-containing protein n=1 Tax=marine sediment metagenome TaxID=412755 RepID=A0A0F9WMF5_9ZZZZ